MTTVVGTAPEAATSLLDEKADRGGGKRGRGAARNSEAAFNFTMALITAAIIFAGFAPSFYLKPVLHGPPPLTLLTATHGVVFTLWALLFVTQSGLIAFRAPTPHRQLGVLGALIFGVMVSLGFSTAITAAKLGHAPPGAPGPLFFLALPLVALTAALILVALGLLNRRRSDWHRRLMLGSFFIMSGPGTGRLAVMVGLAGFSTQLSFIVAEMLMAAVLINDQLGRKRIHPASLIASAVIGAAHLIVSWAAHSPVWLAFAKAITQG